MPVQIMAERDPLKDSIRVRLKTGIKGAVLRYTLDGSEPTRESPACPGSAGEGWQWRLVSCVGNAMSDSNPLTGVDRE